MQRGNIARPRCSVVGFWPSERDKGKAIIVHLHHTRRKHYWQIVSNYNNQKDSEEITLTPNPEISHPFRASLTHVRVFAWYRPSYLHKKRNVTVRKKISKTRWLGFCVSFHEALQSGRRVSLFRTYSALIWRPQVRNRKPGFIFRPPHHQLMANRARRRSRRVSQQHHLFFFFCWAAPGFLTPSCDDNVAWLYDCMHDSRKDDDRIWEMKRSHLSPSLSRSIANHLDLCEGWEWGAVGGGVALRTGSARNEAMWIYDIFSTLPNKEFVCVPYRVCSFGLVSLSLSVSVGSRGEWAPFFEGSYYRDSSLCDGSSKKTRRWFLFFAWGP